MPKILTKEDLKAIGQLVDVRLDAQAKRYSGLLDGLRTEMRHEMRDLAQHFNQSQAKLREEIRKDTEKLLAEHQGELLEAISDLILEDKIASIEARLVKLEKMEPRLSALEGAR